MAVARAGGEGPHFGGRARRSRSRPHQRRARKGAGTRGEDRWRAHHRARSHRAHSQSGRIFRAARRCYRCARALRWFAEWQRVTICTELAAKPENGDLERPASLAAAHCMRYANPGNLSFRSVGWLTSSLKHALNANIPTALKSAPSTASTRARTCWLSIRTNASIVAFANPNVPPTPSSPTPSRGWRSGSRSTPSTPRAGPTSPRRRKRRPTRKNSRVWKASSRSIFPGNPGLATDSPTIFRVNWARFGPNLNQTKPADLPYWPTCGRKDPVKVRNRA